MTNTRFEVTARSIARAAAALALALLIAGCTPVIDKPPSAGGGSIDHPAHPLSDDEAKAQVVDAAKQIVSVTQLPNVSAGFEFMSCNDQGDPPDMGWVQVNFDLPPDAKPDEYFQTIAAATIKAGWKRDQRYQLGPKTLKKDGVSAEIAPLAANPGKGRINLYGECRNMTDHRHDGKTNGIDITAELH